MITLRRFSRILFILILTKLLLPAAQPVQAGENKAAPISRSAASHVPSGGLGHISPATLTDELPPLPDDMMPPRGIDSETGPGRDQTSAAGYSVLPILFVPSDLTTHPYGLTYIDQRMQLVQRWYAEQLRGKTFTLQPAVVVRGSQPLRYYYGTCYPPDDCEWGYEMWDRVFTDLPVLGYPAQANTIQGVFFQNDGFGAPALGGGGLFLVALDADNNRVNPDCLEPGCASSVSKGGTAHELGHALGLPHTVDDQEGSPGVSLMSYGFYGFPQATLVNTALNPERDMLYASPFLNIQMSLSDGGFEDCLIRWSVASGAANCSSTTRRSGLKALALSPGAGGSIQVYQQVAATAQRTYDISAWMYSPDPGNHHTWLQVSALNSKGQVLSSQIFGDLPGATNGWQRVAYSFMSPAQTTSLQIRIQSTASDTSTTYVDDLDVHETKLVPPSPLQMFHSDGDSIQGTRPLLQWDDVTSATTYKVQVATDSSFNSPVMDLSVTSPYVHLPSGLSLNSRYFWRVRAANGSGTSNWSSSWNFLTTGAGGYFSDEFETASLDPAWFWVREDSSNWYMGGPPGRRGTGYIGITAQAGDLLYANNTAKNVLLKNAPAGSFEISTKIDFWEPGLTVNYQQAGLLIYQDDNNYLKLMRIYSDGNKLEWLAEVNGAVVEYSSAPIGANPPIRITRSGNQYTASYSTNGITWQVLGKPVTTNWNTPKIGLAAFSTLNVKQVTAFFDYFRVGVPPRFSDVPFSHWAYNWIDRLYSSTITSGCGTAPLKYCPDGMVNRAQMAVFLLKGIHGSDYAPPSVNGDTGFTDVPLNYWSGAWIKQLAVEGITGGCGSGKFCPEGMVNRAQMAVFLLKAKYGADYVPPAVDGNTGFTDVPLDHWAGAWIKQLAAEGITGGCGANTYCPNNGVTRAQMAVFLVKTFELP